MRKKDTNDLASRLGPGLITGAADDDPSGIATYSQAGSQFGFGLVWTLLLTTPLMIGIQMLSARIGFVTGAGLAANMAKVCPRWMAAGPFTARAERNCQWLAGEGPEESLPEKTRSKSAFAATRSGPSARAQPLRRTSTRTIRLKEDFL